MRNKNKLGDIEQKVHVELSAHILSLLQNSFFASNAVRCSKWYMDMLIQHKTIFGGLKRGVNEITVKH